ncbi:MAG: hypothetical protein K1X75_14490 [Leptospirales bacterium]|nr:hypothetical protein [Leptospirales bacterium]
MIQFAPVYRRLLEARGPLGWWPGRTPFEIMVGAILTQNTSWRNVELAIAELRRRGWLNPRRMAAADPEQLALAIRSSGYYNQKAQKLKTLCRWFWRYGYSTRRLQLQFASDPEHRLRAELLALRGVGPETADSILCYALQLPYFVVDAYTMRWLRRYAPQTGHLRYEELRVAVEGQFRRRFAAAELPGHFNEFHAQLVHHGARVCTARNPDCAQCVLRKRCRRQLE